MVGPDEVAELRSLLRRRDPVARELALGLLETWSPHALDVVGARAVLEAAAGTYPSLAGDHRHPAELLARLLWAQPALVLPADVVRVFLFAADRVRRSFLHLLALRGDDEALSALEVLLDPMGSTDLVPAPTAPVLDPLLAHDDTGRVADVLLGVLTLPGWEWHAADLLGRMEAAGRLDAGRHAAALEAVAHLVATLVDRCDRASAPVGRDTRRPDPAAEDARLARESLDAVARLLDRLGGDGAVASMHRMLASADPRVSAMGAVRLVGLGRVVAPERIDLIARDPVARADLFDGLAGAGDARALRDALGEVELHEASLARWLAEVTELGRAPDEIEFLGTRLVPQWVDSEGLDGDGDPDDEDLARASLFRFRVNSPHWSSARGWMIGLAGPWTGSCYAAEDECSLDEHVDAIRTSLATWPGRPADGTA